MGADPALHEAAGVSAAVPVRPRLRQDLRLAVIMAAVAALATVAVFPYLLQVAPGRFDAVPAPLWVLIAIQALQMFVVVTLLAWAGLRMGHRIGMGSPLLQHWINGQAVPAMPRARPWHSALLGVGAALPILLLSSVLDPWLLPPPRVEMQDIEGAGNALYGLLASFYGGIVEELQLRLFLLTLVAWGLTWLVRRGRGFDGRVSPGVAWIAIGVAALLFGAGHLPTAAGIWGLDAGVIARTVLLNAIGGVVFGWLYWKRGLEMAVLSHFAADIVLHVLVPLLSPQTIL